MKDMVQIFKALSDETRVKILVLISKKNVCAKGISKHLGISEAAISQHIKILKDNNLIVGNKVGYYMHYSINEQVLNYTINFINELKDSSISDISIYGKTQFNCSANLKCAKKCCKHNTK